MKYFLMIFIFGLSYCEAQIGSNLDIQFNEYINDFRCFIDSTKQLENNCEIIYVSNKTFKSKHFKFASGCLETFEAKEKEEYRGYSVIRYDFLNYALLEVRGQGSGNPSYLRVIDKVNESMNFVGKFPFYIDEINEICVFDNNTDIVVKDFKNNIKKEYTRPNAICDWEFCWKMIDFNSTYFIVEFINLENKREQIKIMR